MANVIGIIAMIGAAGAALTGYWLAAAFFLAVAAGAAVTYAFQQRGN